MFLHKIKKILIDALFPQQCIGCDTFGEIVCMSCLSKYVSIQLDTNDNSEIILEHVVSIGNYATPFWKKSIRLLKYSGITDIGLALGTILGLVLQESIVFSEDSIICIPIPLHSKKARERGYNQSECIARGITSITGWHCATDILERQTYTNSQTTLSDEERIKNIQDAFTVNANYMNLLEQSHIILVDDVLTTGATCLEATQTLEKAGAKKVTIATIARGR